MPDIDTTMIIELLNLFLTFFYGVVFTVLFLDALHSRRNRFILILYSVLSVSVQLAVFFLCSPKLVYQLYPLIVHLPLVLVLILGCRCKTFPTFISLFMSYFLTIPRYFLATILMMCFPKLVTSISTGRVIVTIPLAVLIYCFINEPIRSALKRPYRDLRAFAFLLLITYFFPYLISEYTDWINQYPTLIMDFITILLFLFVTYFLSLYFYTFDKNIELLQRSQLLSVSAHALNKQMETFRTMQEEARILRHDERHFASLIEGYARDGNLDAILGQTASLTAKIDEITPTAYCQNEAVNLILCSYLAPFTADQIPVNTHINLPRELFVAEIDFCIILANALENAYHAVTGIEDRPFLDIKINSTAEQLFLKVDNRCRSNISFQNDMPVAADKEHGIGTRSIVYIAKKYGGIYSFAENEGVFTLQVILHKV